MLLTKISELGKKRENLNPIPPVKLNEILSFYSRIYCYVIFIEKILYFLKYHYYLLLSVQEGQLFLPEGFKFPNGLVRSDRHMFLQLIIENIISVTMETSETSPLSVRTVKTRLPQAGDIKGHVPLSPNSTFDGPKQKQTNKQKSIAQSLLKFLRL